MSNGKILIIEDEPDIIEMIRYNLVHADFEVVSATNGEDGIVCANSESPDLIILDIMLPKIDGFEVCRKLKGDDRTCHIPIIILSAKSQEPDKVIGLELGADDYVTKPFSPRELLARVRAILRRGLQTQSKKVVELGEIRIDREKRSVKIAGEKIDLTYTEFNLLEFLTRRPGVVFSRNQIIDGVFGNDSFVYDRTVDAHVKSLRKKLGSAKDYIETIRGAGYRFKEL